MLWQLFFKKKNIESLFLPQEAMYLNRYYRRRNEKTIIRVDSFAGESFSYTRTQVHVCVRVLFCTNASKQKRIGQGGW